MRHFKFQDVSWWVLAQEKKKELLKLPTILDVLAVRKRGTGMGELLKGE
jgi:hypothetical protein